MKRRSELGFGSCIRAGAALLLALGCESIAGVEDVSFSDASSGLSCEAYCDEVLDSCPGDVAVYEDRPTCLGACATFDAGNASRPSGNTVACRLEQATFAAQTDTPVEKAAHCPLAGPGGGNRCASSLGATPDCEGYCSLYMGACKSISKDWGFGTHEECVRKCGALGPATDYSVVDAAESGDTLSCRLYYATAATVDPETNCKSAGLRPSEKCLGDTSTDPSCADYCRAVDVACQGDLQVYESVAQCETVCALTPSGSRTDSGGQDSVGCRISHSYNALLIDPATHCPHSGPAGDGVCSEKENPNCVPYCRLVKSSCGALFEAAYGDDDQACIADCATLTDAGKNRYSVATAESGDTLKCRTLNAARASEDEQGDNAEFCAAAFGDTPCE